MEAWGTGFLENDTALDWCDEFFEAPEGEGSEEEPGKLSFLLGSIQVVREPEEDELDADTASEGVVAAEIIAALNGKPSPILGNPEDDTEKALVAWMRANDEELLRQSLIVDLARAAVERVRDDSELADLWGETDHADEWRATLDDLITRLA
jgi:hypothetical protein